MIEEQPQSGQPQKKKVCVLAESKYKTAHEFLKTWFPDNADKDFLNRNNYVAYFLNYDGAADPCEGWTWNPEKDTQQIVEAFKGTIKGNQADAFHAIMDYPEAVKHAKQLPQPDDCEVSDLIKKIAQADVIFIVASRKMKRDIASILSINEKYLLEKKLTRNIFSWQDKQPISPGDAGAGQLVDQANTFLRSILASENHVKCTWYAETDEQLTEKFNHATGRKIEGAKAPAAVSVSTTAAAVPAQSHTVQPSTSGLGVAPLSQGLANKKICVFYAVSEVIDSGMVRNHLQALFPTIDVNYPNNNRRQHIALFSNPENREKPIRFHVRLDENVWFLQRTFRQEISEVDVIFVLSVGDRSNVLYHLSQNVQAYNLANKEIYFRATDLELNQEKRALVDTYQTASMAAPLTYTLVPLKQLMTEFGNATGRKIEIEELAVDPALSAAATSATIPAAQTLAVFPPKKKIAILAWVDNSTRIFLKMWIPSDEERLANIQNRFVVYFLNYGENELTPGSGLVWHTSPALVQAHIGNIAGAKSLFVVAPREQRLQIAQALEEKKECLQSLKNKELHYWIDRYIETEDVNAFGTISNNCTSGNFGELDGAMGQSDVAVVLPSETTAVSARSPAAPSENLPLPATQPLVVSQPPPEVSAVVAIPPSTTTTDSAKSSAVSSDVATATETPAVFAGRAATPRGTSVAYATRLPTQDVKCFDSLFTCKSLFFVGAGAAILGGGALAAWLVLPPAMTIGLIAGSLAIALALLVAAWIRDNREQNAFVKLGS